MKKKIIISSIVSIILLVVGIFFINSSHKKISTKVSKDWYEVHADGVAFPFNIALEKQMTFLDAITILEPTKSIDHIYFKNNGKWEEVDKNEIIKQDSFLKID